MLNKTPSCSILGSTTSTRLESGAHDSATVIQNLLHNTCNCPQSMTLESALIGLSDEIAELLDEAYAPKPSSSLFLFLTETQAIVESVRLQHTFSGAADYDDLIKPLAKLEYVITILAGLNYQLKELHDVSMMLAWVYHFLAEKDDKYSDLLTKRLDVNSYYCKALRRFKLTRCIRSPRHHTSCRETSSLEWPLSANPLTFPL